MARFNEQIEPIYVLLRETEDVNLSHDLLEPEPTEIPALKQRSVSENVCSIGLYFSHHIRYAGIEITMASLLSSSSSRWTGPCVY